MLLLLLVPVGQLGSDSAGLGAIAVQQSPRLIRLSPQSVNHTGEWGKRLVNRENLSGLGPLSASARCNRGREPRARGIFHQRPISENPCKGGPWPRSCAGAAP